MCLLLWQVPHLSLLFIVALEGSGSVMRHNIPCELCSLSLTVWMQEAETYKAKDRESRRHDSTPLNLAGTAFDGLITKRNGHCMFHWDF